MQPPHTTASQPVSQSASERANGFQNQSASQPGDVRFQTAAIMSLQEAADAYMVKFFEDSDAQVFSSMSPRATIHDAYATATNYSQSASKAVSVRAREWVRSSRRTTRSSTMLLRKAPFSRLVRKRWV